MRKLRQRLEGDLVRAEKRFERKKGASKVKRLLKQIPKELDCLRFEGKGWSALSPGVKAAFSRGRQAYLLANQNPSVGNLHEWRKRVKDLWYQVCVLRPIYPEHMDALAAQLKALSEYLGDDHDLVMLRESVQTDAGVQRELFEPAVLNDLIEQRRANWCQPPSRPVAKFMPQRLPRSVAGWLNTGKRGATGESRASGTNKRILTSRR